MLRPIIIGFWASAPAVESRWRPPDEQRIYHYINVIRLHSFKVEILAHNFHKRSVLYTTGREQVQIQSTTLANHLNVVTFLIAQLSVQVWRVRRVLWAQRNFCQRNITA